MKKFCLSILVIIIISCNQAVKPEKREVLTPVPDSITVSQQENQSWYDTLVKYYISKSDKDQIKAERKIKDKLDWEVSSIEKNDSANYYVFKIGHHESEADGSEMRFTADAWIYIDSISKKIYEYDLGNDTIIVWKK